MTQIVLHQSDNGIVLATDSRAVASSPGGEPRYLKVRKLFHLTPHTVLVTAGAGFGIPLCRSFQAHIAQARIWSLDDIIHRAIPFFRSQIEHVRRENPALVDDPDLDRVYFAIAGHAPGAASSHFRFVVLGAEHAGDTLHPINTGRMAAIPRNLKIEYKLTRTAMDELPLEGIEAIVEDFLVKLAQASDAVGPPFHFVRITEDGVTVRTREDIA